MAEINVNTRAYCKIILHAAKYPHRAVNGVLLAEKGKSKEHKCVKFVDAVPLFHLTLGLAPMLEVALTQIDAYCAAQNLVIAGYYQANEHVSDNTGFQENPGDHVTIFGSPVFTPPMKGPHMCRTRPNLIAEKIADKIHEFFSDAVLFMIQNDKVNMDGKSEAYQIYQLADNKWKPKNTSKLEESALHVCCTMLETKLYRDLIDFDNHLDDIMLDWRNSFINEQLKLTP